MTVQTSNTQAAPPEARQTAETHLLRRYSHNPILTAADFPRPVNSVFNAAASYGGQTVLLCRVEDLSGSSVLWLARSDDGLHFTPQPEPALNPAETGALAEVEQFSLEDPRITYLADEGRFIMAYTAYAPGSITPIFAESTNLMQWRRLGPLVTGEDNKDQVLFPRRIGGRYVSFHRRPPSIWLAYSDDLKTWGDFQEIMQPRADCWDCKRVGGGGVPIETDEGWLVLYHAYDFDHVYRLGVCLLDREDPARVLSRPTEFILEPQEPWELKGDVPNVVFSAANPRVEDTVYVYYGGADRLIGLATCDFDELLHFALMG